MFENPFKAGVLVRHPSLEVGRIVAIQGDRVHVYFHGQQKRWATKFTLDSAKNLLEILPVQSHEWLDHLPPFEWDSKAGAFGMEYERLTHEQAVATFLAIFPGGFEDPKYIGDLKAGERAYKMARVHEWERTFGNSEGERLLRAGDDMQTTHGYVEADAEMKRRTLAALPRLGRGRRSSQKQRDRLIAFLESLQREHPP